MHRSALAVVRGFIMYIVYELAQVLLLRLQFQPNETKNKNQKQKEILHTSDCVSEWNKRYGYVATASNEKSTHAHQNQKGGSEYWFQIVSTHTKTRRARGRKRGKKEKKMRFPTEDGLHHHH